MAEQTDGQLVERVRRGDLSAFEAIVDRHRGAMVAVAATRLRSLDDAEDVAQEAFVQAYFRLHQLREAEALAPWLRRVTDRLALMRLRRRREEPVEPEKIAAVSAATQGGPAAGIEDLLSALPEAQRETIALTCLAGYTCAEAAALLGVREGTVKSRLSRARGKLKEAYAMAGQEMRKAEPKEDFTKETIGRLMAEARRLLAEGDTDGAAERASAVVSRQVKELFDSGDSPSVTIDPEAARIIGLPFREKRRKEAEANAAQYGFRLEELDWEVADVDMMSGTLGKPTGHGKDVWGVPHSRASIRIVDARDVCRRLECSPVQLGEWVDAGCPILRCWPCTRFDLDRVKQWLEENGIIDWPKESVQNTDRPIRAIFKAIEKGELTAEQAEAVITNLGWGNWG